MEYHHFFFFGGGIAIIAGAFSAKPDAIIIGNVWLLFSLIMDKLDSIENEINIRFEDR